MNCKPLTVSYGEAVYVPKYTYHQFKANENFKFLVVNLNQSLSNFNTNATDSKLNVNLHFTLDENTLLLTHFIERQLTITTNAKIEGLLYDLLTELIIQIKPSKRIDSRIINCINAIQQDISAPHTLSTLSEIACLSESHFKVVFKKNLGCTVYEYITELRMKKALGLLTNTDLPIVSVAEKCGYKSASAFIKRFNKYYQQTPHKIRTKPNFNGQ